MSAKTPAQLWKGPTVEQIAKVARVGVATVDRVLNNRNNVRENTRLKVLAALDKLKQDLASGCQPGRCPGHWHHRCRAAPGVCRP